MRERRPLPIGIAAAALLTVAVFAQTNKWYDPYQKGVKAFEARDYQGAIKLLEQAVAADPKAGANKYVEGVFRTDYFPYYYLGVAYLELHNYDKAQQNFSKAKDSLSRDLSAKLNQFQQRLTAELSAGNRVEPPKPVEPAKPLVNQAFEAAVRQAEAALAARRFADAVSSFDVARKADAAEYSKQNIQVRREEASRGVAGQLAEEGRQLLQASQLNAAKTKFQQAEQILPGQKSVADGLAEIKRHEDNYQRLKNAAEQDVQASNFQAAKDKLDQARTAHRERFAAEDLEARVNFVNDKLNNLPNPKQAESQRLFDQARAMLNAGNYAAADKGFAAALAADPKNQAADDALQKSRRFATLKAEGTTLANTGNKGVAQQRLADARSIDPTRFDREGLGAILDRLTRQPGVEPDKLALRNALLALLQGHTEQTIAILEPTLARRQVGDTPMAAALHAYLGVAYATQALSAPKQEDQVRLRERALEQFRLAISAQRDYQLSGRVVSPKIVTLFEQARVG